VSICVYLSADSEMTASSPLLIAESYGFLPPNPLAFGTLLSPNEASINEGASYPYNALNGVILMDIW
jgi:hypothetical protein